MPAEWVWATKDGVVSARNGRLSLRAEGIRNAHTGKHATVTVSIDGHDLAGDLFNFERMDGREKLGRKAWAKLGGDEKKQYPLDFFQDAIWRFSLKIWSEFTKAGITIEEAGADEEPPDPTFPLYPYVMDGGGSIMFALPKAGKSYLLYLMAASIDSGCQKLWRADKRRVMIVNLERSKDSVNRRLWYVNQTLGLDANRRIKVIQKKGSRLDYIYDSIANAVQADGIEVLMLDSISRSGYGKLSDDEVANQMVNALNALCPTWEAIGHTPRADPSHSFGSIMFNAGQDIGIRVNSKRSMTRPGTLGVSLEALDANDLPDIPMEIMALDFEGFHLAGARKSSAREFPSLATAKVDLIDTIEDFLLGTGPMTATDIAHELGCDRSNLSRLLANDPRFRVARKDGRDVLYEANTGE